MTEKKKSNARNWRYIVGGLFLLGLIGGWFTYDYFFKSNVTFSGDKEYLYIHTNANFDDVLKTMKSSTLIKDVDAFAWLARNVGYDKNVKPGRYKLRKRMSNKDLVLLLRSGKQEPECVLPVAAMVRRHRTTTPPFPP